MSLPLKPAHSPSPPVINRPGRVLSPGETVSGLRIFLSVDPGDTYRKPGLSGALSWDQSVLLPGTFLLEWQPSLGCFLGEEAEKPTEEYACISRMPVEKWKSSAAQTLQRPTSRHWDMKMTFSRFDRWVAVGDLSRIVSGTRKSKGRNKTDRSKVDRDWSGERAVRRRAREGGLVLEDGWGEGSGVRGPVGMEILSFVLVRVILKSPRDIQASSSGS